MFEDSGRSLLKNKEAFQENVQDAFGDYIVEEFFNELEKENHYLQETDDNSQRETRNIKNLLRELRAIV